MANTRKTDQAGKKPKRRNARTQTKAAKKVLPLSSREPVRTATIKSAAKPLKRKHPKTNKEAAVLTLSGARKSPAFSFFDSQIQLFNMMLQWSPFVLLLSQHARFANAIFAGAIERKRGNRDRPSRRI